MMFSYSTEPQRPHRYDHTENFNYGVPVDFPLRVAKYVIVSS